MAMIGVVLYWALGAYLGVLIARMILSWVPMFAPDWQPRGVLLVLAEAVYTLTDPPLKWLGRLIPPVRMGNVGLDVGFIVLWFAVALLRQAVVRVFFF